MQPLLDAFRSITSWIYLHPALFTMGVIGFVSALNGALKKHRKAPSLVSWLDVFLDLVSLLSRRDATGTFKLPMTTSKMSNGVHVEDKDPTERQTIDRASLRALLPLLFLATALMSCAAPWRAAAIAISTVDRAAVKAAQEWEGYDVAHETAIVDEAIAKNRPHETAKREVDAWRKTADRVDLAFIAVKDASSAAKAGVVMASQGKASIAGVISALLDGVRVFLDVLRIAGVKLPGELAALIGGAL
jgi:hypothetical protein